MCVWCFWWVWGLFDIWWFVMGTRRVRCFWWGQGLFDVWFAMGTRLAKNLMVCDGDEAFGIWFAIGTRLVWFAGLQWRCVFVSDGDEVFDVSWFAMGDKACLVFNGLWCGRGVWYLMVCDGDEACLIFDGLRRGQGLPCLIFGLRWGWGLFDIWYGCGLL